jgi:small subunit ribosomal protein S4e
MKNHLKRQEVPKEWPIERKGTKYVVRPDSDLKKGVPILVALRDMIKVAKNKKEVKRALHLKNILVNGKAAKDEKISVLLFDVIKIIPSGKNYRMNISSSGKFMFEEIDEKDAELKVSKIIGKKILKGKKEQLNLLDGKNFISNEKCEIGDSLLINSEKKKIVKCVPLKEKSEVVVFSGKHSGKKGVIIEFKKGQKTALIEINKEKINVLIKQIIAVK